jgi:hypothetical protein
MFETLLFAENPALPLGSAIAHHSQNDARNFQAAATQAGYTKGKNLDGEIKRAGRHTVSHFLGDCRRHSSRIRNAGGEGP